jgi:peptide deformylase
LMVVGSAVICLTVLSLLCLAGWKVADKVRLQRADSMSVVMSPNEILITEAQPVDEVGEEERTLALLMENKMKELGAAGLAAPQVGVSERLIVLNLAQRSTLGLGTDYQVVAMVNPEITRREGAFTHVEGCLSLPRGTEIEITRSRSISVEYTTLEGQDAVLDAEGLNAAQIQHEIDHLDGILVTDYAKRFNFNRRLEVAAALYLLALTVAVGLYVRNRARNRKRTS